MMIKEFSDKWQRLSELNSKLIGELTTKEYAELLYLRDIMSRAFRNLTLDVGDKYEE